MLGSKKFLNFTMEIKGTIEEEETLLSEIEMDFKVDLKTTPFKKEMEILDL